LRRINMFAKIEIIGKITVVTGMHIGGSSQFSAIGAVDSPVIRDSASDLPMIPGSSLKGKMRTLLAKQYNTTIVKNPDDDHDRLTRLFGSSKKGKRGRLIFSDMTAENLQELKKVGISSTTEIKFENTINRISAVANPRQIERVIRGTEFGLRMIYDVEKAEDMEEDFRTICDGLKLLEYDYLGGHGTRGYGKIKFSDMDINVVAGDVEADLLEQCSSLVGEV